MLDAGVEVFARDGYHGAGVEEIATMAGISKPMVYLYFGSKEQLFVSCIRREAARLHEIVAGSVDVSAATSYERLQNALRAFFGFVADRRGAWSVLYRKARAQGPPVSDEVAALRAQMIEAIADMLVRARAVATAPEVDDEAFAAAHALVGACESLADWMVDQPAADPEVAAQRLMRFAWSGLAQAMQSVEPAATGQDRVRAGEALTPES